MRHEEIADCLNLGVGGKPLLMKVLTEKLLDFVKFEDGFRKFRQEAEKNVSGKIEIQELPLEDACWLFTEIPLNHHDLSNLRMLVLSDTDTSKSWTVQFSLGEVAQLSYEDQALKLLYQGCLHPLDGRKSRRPRFLCLNTPHDASNAIQLECDQLGIQFCGEMAFKKEFESQRNNFRITNYVRQCSVCGISGTPALFDECYKCGAVLYCGDRCKTDDWQESHLEWCSQFKEFMASEKELANLPFKFASETTALDFHEQKRKEFLSRSEINDQSLLQLDNQPFKGLKDYTSPHELCPLSLDNPLTEWKEYYSLRGLPLHSPIAVLLHFSMTLYYIITQLLPKDFHETFATIQQSSCICVHVIGAEKEVDMFSSFLECARLLAPLSLDIHLFGDNFGENYHGQELKEENLHFKNHKGLYHKADHKDIPSPSLAVCFNGGIGAYTSYIKTIKFLMRKKTPVYYTDYGQACIMFSSSAITNSQAGVVSPPIINPFRCPLRMVASDQNLPRYSNAFITHIKPFSPQCTSNQHLS